MNRKTKTQNKWFFIAGLFFVFVKIMPYCLLGTCMQVRPVTTTGFVSLEPVTASLTGPHTGSLIHLDEINDKLQCIRIKGGMWISERIIMD